MPNGKEWDRFRAEAAPLRYPFPFSGRVAKERFFFRGDPRRYAPPKYQWRWSRRYPTAPPALIPWGMPTPEEVLLGEANPAIVGYPAGEGYNWVKSYDPTTRTYRWREQLVEPSTAPTPIEEPKVRSFGGYDYQYTVTGFDNEGKPIYGWERIGPTGEPATWDIMQAFLARQEREEAARVSAEQWGKEFAAQQALRQWQMRQPTGDGSEAAIREAQWQAMRAQQLLAWERGGPMNWIKMYQLEQQERPPWVAPALTPGQHRQANVFMGLSQAAELRNILAQPWAQGELTGSFLAERNRIQQALKETEAEYAPALQELRALAREQEAEHEYARGMGFEIKAAPPRPTTPPTPQWLTEFVPGLVAGQPLTRQPFRIPSGQLWARTPWEQQQMFGGYTEWMGRPYADVLSQMAMMMPEPVAGAVGRRWQPARQWA